MSQDLWLFIAEGLSRQWPAAAWEAARGVELVREMLEAGLLSAIPARPGGAWPCGENARGECAREVVARGGELVAVCGQAPASCAAEVLAPVAALITVEREVFLGRLA